MKKKTIKKILKNVHSSWVETIQDETVRALAKNNTIITGGCIASMLLKESVNDYDVYFRSKEAAWGIANYYVDKFKALRKENVKGGVDVPIYLEDNNGRIKIVCKSAGVASENNAGSSGYQYFESQRSGDAGDYLDEVLPDQATSIDENYEMLESKSLEEAGPEKYRPVFCSTNAITLSHKVQLVFRFYGEPGEIHENYDFVHCTNYWTSWNQDLVLRQEALETLLARELRYVGSRYPVCSVIRLRKFIKRGWSINAGQILKMAMQISALDLNDVNVLEDQLTGVDSAYFLEVIDKMKEKDTDRIDSAYLIEIIDRIF